MDQLFINRFSIANLVLNVGGGNVGIGVVSPTEKLDVG